MHRKRLAISGLRCRLFGLSGLWPTATMLICWMVGEVALGAGWQPVSSPLAQLQRTFSLQPSDWDHWLKVVVLAVIVMGTYLTFYFVVFPNRLRSGGSWPRSLYGWCNALAWLLSVVAALIIFWQDLPIMVDGKVTPLGQYGPRIGVGLLAVGGAAIWWFAFRSSRQK